MNAKMKSAVATAAVLVSVQAMAEVVFYENNDFRGQSFTANRPIRDFRRFGFNDHASSAVVYGQRWERWEVCEDIRFGGQCMILRPGRYPSLAAMGMNNRISSVRQIDRNARVEQNRYAPAPLPVYDARRRPNERIYQANVIGVREVLATPERRCWVEQEQVQNRRDISVPGAVVGAVVGGILGHQVGQGNGRTAATVGGAAIGGAVGSQVGRGTQATTRDVQRCENVPGQARIDYYDVTYNFRGQEHHVQMTNPPGPTIAVNSQGEPRA